MNKIFKIYVPLIIVVTSLLLSSLAFTKESTNRIALAKATALETEVVDGNRIFNYINNRGAWCTHNNPIGWGMQWPGESGLSINFASGVWVAGVVEGDILTACAEFTYEFQPGPIINGVAPAPDDPNHTIAKVNKADLLDEGFTNPDYDLWLDYAQYGAPVMKTIDGLDSLSESGKKIPAMIGDQMLWMVMNDLDPGAHSGLYHTNPIGLEVQTLVWVFNRPDEFGDMMFMKFLIVNKGANPLVDTYVGLWFDIDLGDSNDDLVFCDTTLSLGGFWNGEAVDNEFPIPPAVGADFFQGPIVASPGDTANVSGVKYPGFKNLPMSSFAKYVRGGSADEQDPETAQEAYNFMRGLNGLGDDVINPLTGEVTKYVNISDPETGEGWVDGITTLPADRRMLMNTGPFTLDVWIDTNGDGIPQVGEPGVQEVVAGFMIAQGTSAANSATRLKQSDEKAQLAYDLNFALPPVPANPAVEVHELDGEIILTWDDAIESYTAIDRVDVDEEGNPTYYTFQGYNVYQVNTPTVGPDTRIMKVVTYDIVDGVKDIRDFTFSEQFGENVEGTVQRATDSGISRAFRTTVDALNGNRPLSNWNAYWFVVTAYGYNENGVPKKLESPFTTIEVVPQPPADGLVTKAQYNDMIAAANPDTAINAEHTSTGALSDGKMEVYVVDPTQITGDDYEVTFEQNEDLGQIVWHLKNATTGNVILEDQTNQSGDENYNMAEGLMVKIIGPDPGINTKIPGPFGDLAGYNGWSYEGARWISWGTDWGGETWSGSFGNGIHFFGSTLGPADYVDIRMEWAGDTKENEPDRWSRGAVYRRDKGYAFEGLGDLPFAAYDDSDPNNPRRVNACFVEMDGIASLNNPETSIPANGVWDMGWHEMEGDTGFAESGGREYLFIMLSDYDEATGGGYNDENFGPEADVLYAYWPGPRGTTPFLDGQWTMTIFASKVNYVNDLFSFSTANYKPDVGRELAKTAAQQVNIFPNPYLGQNRAEINPVERFVTITHLPESGATIRIFTLAGSLIKTINDDIRSEQGTLGSHIAQWDLRNDNDVPIASGVYIIHVDMGDLGEKVLKAAVFMPEERLDKF